jgi:type IV pilus assembly protein PilA
MKKNASNRESFGFTLIELMIVVAIIGILAAIAVPQYQTYIAKSQVTRVMYEATNVKNAIEICISEGKTKVGTAETECNPGAAGSSLMASGGNTAPASPIATGFGVPTVPLLLEAPFDLEVEFGNAATVALKGQKLTWRRASNGTWDCSTSVDLKYRPAGC